MKSKEQSREELAKSMGIDLSHLTEEEIEVTITVNINNPTV